MAEAFARFAGIDLLATLPDGEPDRDGFAAPRSAAGMRVADDDSWADIFSRVLVEKIEPKLGIGRADHPRSNIRPGRRRWRGRPRDPRVAERFELYACGVELANGFGELTDAAEQRARLEREMAEKERIYGERYPIDEDFLAALAQMPQASGIALGFDRLVMLATGAARIEQVLWTPMKVPMRAPKQVASTKRRLAQCRALCGAGLVARGSIGELAKVAGALCGRDHAGHGRADRSARPARSDRAAVRARCARADAGRGENAPTRSATTHSARSRASCIAIPTACC